MKYDFILDFVHGVVKEYDWTMPKYNKEEYDDYDEYECECLDIGHDYEQEIAEIAVDRMVRAGKLSRQDIQNCGDEISEAVWDEISEYIIANMDEEYDDDNDFLQGLLDDAETEEMIGYWLEQLLEATGKPNVDELTVEEIRVEIDDIKGTIQNEEIVLGISEFAEKNIEQYEAYLKVLEEMLNNKEEN